MITRTRPLLVLLVLTLGLVVGCAAPKPAEPPVTPSPTLGAAPQLPGPTRTQPAPTAVPPTATAAPSPTSAPKAPVPVRVFCAGSLMIPFAALEPAFEAANPDLDMQMEAHGSIQVIRHVTDIHEEIDVVASADHALLSMLMYNTLNPDTGQPYAAWNIRFATNRVVVAYDPASPGANEITTENWAEIVSRPRTRVGLSDPRFDALGYRQLMILQLAEPLYGRKTLFEDVLMGRFARPIRAEAVGDGTVIHVPELLDPRPGGTIVLRGASIQLIPLLQSGDVDYLFEYESVAEQHGLRYVALPDALNLGDPAHDADYRQVTVQLDFRRFASVEPVFRGETIAYGLTIPANAPQPEAATRWVAFLLGTEGRRIMAENDHPLLDPLRADHWDRLPEPLKLLCTPE